MASKVPLAAEPLDTCTVQPEQPKLQKDVHFVLRLEADLKDLSQAHTHSEGEEEGGAADSSAPSPHPAAGPGDAAAAEQPALDPSTLSLQVKFTPWSGQEVMLGPASLSASEPTDGDVAAPLHSSVARRWVAERHFKLCVDEAMVRSMAATHGELLLPITLAQPPPPPPAKPVKGQPPPPEVPAVSLCSWVPLPCAPLLVGDTRVDMQWPGKLRDVPPELRQLVSRLQVTLQALSMPEPTPEEVAAAAAAAAAVPAGKVAGKTAAKPGAKGAPVPPPEPDLSELPGSPTPILCRELARRLNPMVITPLRASSLPDAPATTKQLDTACLPIRLRLKWPQQGSQGEVLSEQEGRAGPWATSVPRDKYGPGLSSRAVGFGQCLVLLVGDMTVQEAQQQCHSCPIVLEVHDRTAVPVPPEFPVKVPDRTPQAVEGTEPSDATTGAPGPVTAVEEEGYVCGIARVPLLDLARGGTCSLRFKVPLAPYTTIRGAASLDWTRRPGNYAASQALIKGSVRLAVKLSDMADEAPTQRVFSRAVFVFDYRDSELFHLLEDTIRQQNAWTLGFASPVARDAALSGSVSPGRPQETAGPGGPPTQHYIQGGPPELERRPSRGDSTPRADMSETGSDSRGLTHLPPKSSFHGVAASGGLPVVSRGVGGRVSRGDAPGAAARVVTLPRASLVGGKDRKELRFHDFGGVSDSEVSGGGSDCEEEAPASAAEVALGVALSQLSAIKLDTRLLQALSTCRLTPQQLTDTSLDLLTGWHLVDGRERVVAVEGRAEGAMTAIQAIFNWAIEDAQPAEGWRRRAVLFNRSQRYSSRMWGELGVDLHILKLAAPITKLVADAASYATGMVRAECIAGLRRLAALRTAPWARVADSLCLYPTPHMLHLVDKKFGGELTKTDVFGMDVLDDESDDDAIERGGGVSDDARSSISSRRSTRSSRSRKSSRTRRTAATSRKSKQPPKPQRSRPRLQPLDRSNDAYLAAREEARARRIATDWHSHNLAHLASLEATATSIREGWATWNPQRAAARQLEEAMASGTLAPHTQQEWGSQRTPLPGTLGVHDARQRGWYPHATPFKWPAPQEPGSYSQHPHAPSQFRVEQLSEPWDEEALISSSTWQEGSVGPAFVTTVKNKTGLFGQDPEYFKTVHLGGEGREKEEAERVAAEKAEWQRKLLVDDPVMRTTLPLRPKPTQTDRVQHILHDAPKKKGFAIAHVPPAPYSMHTAEPWEEASILHGMRGKDNPAAFIQPGKDFQRHLAVQKRAVSTKAGPQYMQSWTASIHDARYQDA